MQDSRVMMKFCNYDLMDESEEQIVFKIYFIIIIINMEDLTNGVQEHNNLPTLIQYGVKLPFRIMVVGQTDNGKTHSIIKRWLGGKVSFWRYIHGELRSCELQHCLYCSNSGMSEEEKQRLKEEFIDESHEEPQRLFHLNRLPEKKELFEFIASMINNDERSRGVVDDKLKKPSSRKRDKEGRISRVVNQEKSFEEIVFSENEE